MASAGQKTPAHADAAWPVRLLYRDYLARPEVFHRRVETVRGSLVPYLRAWERHGVYIGMASWTVPRWIGTLYRRWYGTGREFARHVLEEYGQCFLTTCLDVGPNRMPLPAVLRRLSAQAPPDFLFATRVADESLTYRFPYGHPDPARRGERNERFLDAALLEERVLTPLRVLERAAGVVVLQVARVYGTEEMTSPLFLSRLRSFLDRLPRGPRYALEVRNPEYVVPDYLACLREYGVAHVLRNGMDTPPLIEELQAPGVMTADTVVAYVSAVHGETVLAARETVRCCVEGRRSLFLYVDDATDENMPAVVRTLLQELNPLLAGLSPIRRRAA
jgi:uncharacterized protein YecE (DUF72 family)